MLKIISGGQTGADRAALDAWHKLGFPTGGFAPKGYLTEKGDDPSLKELGLEEIEQQDYRSRTMLNVREAGLTIIFGRSSAGSLLTKSLCEEMVKPYKWFVFPECKYPLLGVVRQIVGLIKEYNVDVLNIAGNRESKNPGIYGYVYNVVTVIGKDLSK